MSEPRVLRPEDLTGVRVLRGAREIALQHPLRRDRRFLVAIDDESYAFRDRGDGTLGIDCLGQGPTADDEILDAARELLGDPIVANFIWRPGETGAPDALYAIDEQKNLIVLRIGLHPDLIGGGPSGQKRLLGRDLDRRMIVAGNPTRWVVHDIVAGDRSQLARSVPGNLFSANSIDSFLSILTVNNLRVVVEYVGDLPQGEPFVAAVLGTQAEDRLAVLWTPEGCYEPWLTGTLETDQAMP